MNCQQLQYSELFFFVVDVNDTNPKEKFFLAQCLLWREFPQFPQFPKPENQGFSTVPDYQSLKIVPIFGSMLHF